MRVFQLRFNHTQQDKFFIVNHQWKAVDALCDELSITEPA